MKKIVVNSCFGGYSLSEKGMKLYRKLKEAAGHILPGDPDKDNPYSDVFHEMPRDDKHLVSVVEQLGDAADGEHAELDIIEIPTMLKTGTSVSMLV